MLLLYSRVLGESMVRPHWSDSQASTGQKEPAPWVLARDGDTCKMQISAFLRERLPNHTRGWLCEENIVKAVWPRTKATLSTS